jgi:PST family polysaccharide transporter
MGFIIVAKNRQLIFVGAELAWTLVNVGLLWLCIGRFGLNGAGIGFVGSYVFYGFLIYPIVRVLSGFRWSTTNRKTGLLFLTSIVVVLWGFYLLPFPWAAGVGATVTVLSALYSLNSLLNLLSVDQIPERIRRLLMWLRLDLRGS